MRRFVIGDIHARQNALKEVLEKCKFDKEKDTLIVLGDVVDGGKESKQVVDELLTIKNIVYIIGNHDFWHIEYLKNKKTPNEWVTQGGANTLKSYGGKVLGMDTDSLFLDLKNVDIPQSHKDFFKKGLFYFEFENMLFVHGGYDPNKPIVEQDFQSLMWDRDLIKNAHTIEIKGYDKVFVGHTSTQMIEREFVNYHCRDCSEEWSTDVTKVSDMTADVACPKCNSENIQQSLGCVNPIKIGKLYCLDTGAGWDGKLTIMDIDTDEFWQSQLQVPAIR